MNKVTPTENVRLDFVYDASSTLIGVNTSEGNYFYIRDITGNIIGLIDNEGKYIVKYRYDAWEKVLENKILKSCIASRHNPFVYKGYFLDEETGFYYLKSRYYDPVIRRFIQSVDLQGLSPSSLSGLNPFSYANNNPIGNAYSSYSGGRGVSGGMVGSIGDVSNIDLGGISRINNFSSKTSERFRWPKANSIVMTHHTESLIKNPILSWIIGNISYTATVQLNHAETFYSFSNIGNGGNSIGVGMNLENWIGYSVYVSDNIGFGSNWQLTPWLTGGSSWSLTDGISLSGGIIVGDTTHEITVSIGNGALLGYAACAAMATVPVPGMRAAAAVVACVIFIIDIFN